jgi:hypothetical protein
MKELAHRRIGRSDRVLNLLMLVILVACAPAWAGGNNGNAGTGLTAAEVLEARIASGDLEYRDPQTGHIVVATAERVAEIRNELAPRFDRPPSFDQTVLADGTVRAEVNGDIRDVHIVRVNLDGAVEVACVRSLDAAVSFMVGLGGNRSTHGDASVGAAAAE